jgi:DNA-binding protein Fis
MNKLRIKRETGFFAFCQQSRALQPPILAFFAEKKKRSPSILSFWGVRRRSFCLQRKEKNKANVKTCFSEERLTLDKHSVEKNREFFHSSLEETSVDKNREFSHSSLSDDKIENIKNEETKEEKELTPFQKEIKQILSSYPAELGYKERNDIFELLFPEYRKKELCTAYLFKSWLETKVIRTDEIFRVSMKKLYNSFKGYILETGKIREREIPSLLQFSRNFKKIYKNHFEEEIKIVRYGDGLNLLGFILKSE